MLEVSLTINLRDIIISSKETFIYLLATIDAWMFLFENKFANDGVFTKSYDQATVLRVQLEVVLRMSHVLACSNHLQTQSKKKTD